MTVKFITLGCKTNIYESEAMAALFENDGFEIITNGIADIYVVNTCTVTGTGASKSLKMIRRARRENPNACLAVTGCFAQTEPERLKDEGVDVLIGNDRRRDIVPLCKLAIDGKKTYDIKNARELTNYEELGIVHRQRRARAEIKIEDGCNNFCTYCKIPYARGPVRSRDIKNIIKEAKALKNDGYAEIVLTGIHIGSYGKDLKNGLRLIDVTEAVSKAADGVSIRLGSLEPVMIDNDFVARASKLKNLCPQFHLSLQSGCDRTLKAMNRHYTASQFKEAVCNLRKAFPDCAITTDLIVGFPGETDQDFEESKSFCIDIGFSQMHIFPYSVREGTAAEKLPNHISESVKVKRTHTMLEIAFDMKASFCKQYIGKEISVLFEQKKGKLWCGTSLNYIDVRAESDLCLKGRTVTVKITGYNKDNEFLIADLKEII